MSIDLESQLERGLQDLAEAAPVPRAWPTLTELWIERENEPPVDEHHVIDLLDPVVAFRPRRRRRRSGAIAAVCAAAAAVVVAVVIVANVDRPATVRSAAPPPETSVPTTPATGGDWGRWDPAGPRLSNAELSQLVSRTANPDGTSVWHPVRLGIASSGVVSSVDVVKSTLGDVSRSALTVAQSAESSQVIMQYLRSLDAQDASTANNPGTTPVWVVALSGRFHIPEPTCAKPTVDTCPDHPVAIVTMIGVDGLRLPLVTALLSSTQVDLATLGPVGHWTPS
jgi:hypothetical protein